MHRQSFITLAAGLQDPEAKRQVILGGAVLLLSAMVVGLVHTASTTPDFMVKMRLYVNPEAARICALARCGLSPVVTVVGFAGCVTCLILAFRRAKNKTSKPESLLGLGEASHWSYLMHASILAFICLMGIISRPIALNPNPVIVIELTNPDLKRSIPPVYTKHSIPPIGTVRAHCGRMANLIASASRTNGVVTLPYRRRARPVVASKSKMIDGSKTSVPNALPPPFSSCLTSGWPNAPQLPRSPCLTPQSEAPIVAGCDILPSSSVDDPTPLNGPAQRLANQVCGSIECKLEAPPDSVVEQPTLASQDMGFDRSRYLTTMYESGEAFGLISKTSALEDALGDFIEEEEVLPERPPIKFAVLEPEMVSEISVATGGLPMLSRRRSGELSNILPPSPHRVSTPQNFEDLASPNVPANSQRDDGEPFICRKPGIDFGPYMEELQKKIKEVWARPHLSGFKIRATKLRFKIAKNGTISGLQLFKTSGDSLDDLCCIRAVENAAPLGPLPKGSPSEVDIEFTFTMTDPTQQGPVGNSYGSSP